MRYALETRKGIVTALETDAPLAAAATGGIFGLQAPGDPAWPFIKCGPPNTIPRPTSCAPTQEETTMAVHAFAKGPGENACDALVKRIVAVLDDARLELEPDLTADVFVTSTTILPDVDEADAFHGVVNLRITAG